MTESIEIPTYAALNALTGLERWTRGTARILEGSIRLETSETYDPCAPHVGESLLFGLAAVRTKGDAIAFARSYGLLFTRSPKPGDQESLSDWLLQARELQRALTMHAQAQAFSDAPDDQKEGVAQALRKSIAPYRSRLDLQAQTFLDLRTIDQQASILIAEIVTAHLPPQRLLASASLEQDSEHGVVLAASGAKPAYFWSPRIGTLVQFAYHMLALALQSGLPVRVCPGCNRVFVPDPADKHYHSKECGAAARQRAHRLRTRPA